MLIIRMQPLYAFGAFEMLVLNVSGSALEYYKWEEYDRHCAFRTCAAICTLVAAIIFPRVSHIRRLMYSNKKNAYE